MIRAAIDIGSNTTLFLVAQQQNDGKWQLLEESLTTNGLGRATAQDGGLTVAVQKRNLKILQQLVARASALGAQEIRAVGTAALRKATNANEFVDYIKKEIGLEITVISGQEEARLTYRGALVDFPDRRDAFYRVPLGHDGACPSICVVDVGGGSSEIVFGNGPEIIKAWSIPLGAVSLTQSLVPSQPLATEQMNQIQQFVQSELEQISVDDSDCLSSVIAVGGTAATLAALKLSIDLSELWKQAPISISRSAIDEFWQEFAGKSVPELAKIPHLPPDRAGIITAGTAILLGIMQKFRIENIILSNKGLRWGILIDDK